MKGGIFVQTRTFFRHLFKSRNRQLLTTISAGFTVYVLLAAGIFSYFHSEDAVTNRFSAPNGSVTLIEPNWDSTGSDMAAHSEPGMHILKDPTGLNDGEIDLYIRLVLTLDASRYTAKNDDYAQAFPDDEVTRVNRILDHIMLENGGTSAPFLQRDAESNPDVCGNSAYYFEPVNHGTPQKPVYYFYYIGTNTGENPELQVVPPDGRTEPALFDYVDIPTHKKDYFGVFDQPYTITVKAEGIPAVNHPGLKAKSEDGIKGAAEVFAEENA